MDKLFILKWLKLSLMSLMCFLMPIKPLILSVIFIVLIDTIFGICKSLKLGYKFTSGRFFSFFKKVAVYSTAVIGTYYLDVNLIGEFIRLILDINLVLTKIITFGIVFNELRSIDENLTILGYKIPSYIKNLFKFTKVVKEGLDEMK